MPFGKNEEEVNAQKGNEKLKIWLRIIVCLILVAVFIGYHTVVMNNEAGHYVMLEPFSGEGHYDPHMEPGRFYKGINRPITYEKSATAWFSINKDEGGDTNTSVAVRYNDGGTADISGSVRYTIEYNEKDDHTKDLSKKKFTQLHVQYRNERNFKDRAIRTLVTEALTLSSTLMSAEESYTTKKAQFTQMALDQLNKGVYLVETYVDTETLPSGETREIKKNKVKRYPEGHANAGDPIRKEYALRDFDITFSQFVISDPEYHNTIKDQIKDKLTNLMGKVASVAEAELNSAKEAQAIEEGKKGVVISEYVQKVKNVAEVIQQDMNAAKERIPAETGNIVSEILKDAALHQKEADILTGQGDAYYKNALQKADSNMEIRLELWLAGHRAKAAIIGRNGELVPKWVFPDSTNQADTGLAILNYNAMQNTKLADKTARPRMENKLKN